MGLGTRLAGELGNKNHYYADTNQFPEGVCLIEVWLYVL